MADVDTCAQAFKLAWFKADRGAQDKLLLLATTWAVRTPLMKSQWQPLIEWSCTRKRTDVDDLESLMSGLNVTGPKAKGAADEQPPTVLHHR